MIDLSLLAKLTASLFTSHTQQTHSLPSGVRPRKPRRGRRASPASGKHRLTVPLMTHGTTGKSLETPVGRRFGQEGPDQENIWAHANSQSNNRWEAHFLPKKPGRCAGRRPGRAAVGPAAGSAVTRSSCTLKGVVLR